MSDGLTYVGFVSLFYNLALSRSWEQAFVLVIISATLMFVGKLLADIEHARQIKNIKFELMRKGVFLNDKD